MAVPFIDILRFEPGFKEGFTQDLLTLVDKGQFVGGPVVSELETSLKKYTESSYVIGCANGTDAIQLALRASGVSKDDLVVIPNMTFWATFEAVVNVGAKPITLDVSRETLHLTVQGVKEAIEKYKPRAIIMVHLYGWASPDTIEIRKLCHQAGVVCIEDCAQAIGTKIDGKSVIGQAQVATTSFYPAKVLGASGDAGAVFTSDESIAIKTRQLVNHGRTDHYEHGLVGWNSRLGAYEATFLQHSLPHLDKRLDSRRAALQYYRENLKNPMLKLAEPSSNVIENGYLQVGMMEPKLRIEFIEYLKKNQIGFGTVYPGAMSEQSGAKDFLHAKIDHGHSSWIAKAVINLPCFAYINEAELEEVTKVVNSFHS
jgi:UDP-2-acetamido-2-deoxy-ribo-hexuluronate aminotransferase